MTAAFPGLVKSIDAGMEGKGSRVSYFCCVEMGIVLVAYLNRPDRLGLAGIIRIGSGAQYFVSCSTGISPVDPGTIS